MVKKNTADRPIERSFLEGPHWLQFFIGFGFFIQSFQVQAVPWSEACLNPTGDCGFYSDCLENRNQCNSTGYALGYGKKYCEKFSAQTRFSARGVKWVNDTRLCLQQHLLQFVQPDQPPMDCEEIMNAAFDSHPDCYTLTGDSICDLPLCEIELVLQTIGEADLLSRRGLKQIASVAQKCIFQTEMAINQSSTHLSTSLRSLSETNPSSSENSLSFELQSDLKNRMAFWRSWQKSLPIE